MAPPLAPPVSAVQARYALLGVFFFSTSIELFAPLAALLVLNLLSSFCIFLWYCRDRDATGRRRSLGRNIGIILLPFIAVPWYLMRRQPLRGKARALLRFVGFVGLMMSAGLAGALLTALIAGLLGMDFGPTV
ncbi:hypothetical protein [Massilia sp. S19_KUP03_FR1]|uniref:hypothetical protein n=1 Tax=Massilia sp. S19_KUP03_FR1 TaxID=3025503 RepID=UPI002FCD80EC